MRKHLLFIFVIFFILSIPVYRVYKKFSRIDLTVVGFVKMADGLGRQTVEIIDALRFDLKINYKGVREKDDLQDVPKELLGLLKKKHKLYGKVVLFEDVLNKQSHLFFERNLKHLNPSIIKIAYSMTESSAIPQDWAYVLNRHFDAVVVPDPYYVKVYQDSGVKKPIFVLPLGLNLKSFLEKPIKKNPHHPFVFANFGSAIARKNHKLMIMSFHAAFKNDPAVELRINSRYSFDHAFEELSKLVNELNATNIKLNVESLNNEAYLNAFANIDCFVSLSQGEGYSIQPREAMALGIPVMISDNTAQSTLCKYKGVLAVPSQIPVPAYYEILRDVSGFRYDVTQKDATEAFLQMKNNYDIYLKHSEDLRQIAKMSDYSELRPLYLTLVKPKKVVLCGKNLITKECLMTSSEELYKKYKQL